MGVVAATTPRPFLHKKYPGPDRVKHCVYFVDSGHICIGIGSRYKVQQKNVFHVLVYFGPPNIFITIHKHIFLFLTHLSGTAACTSDALFIHIRYFTRYVKIGMMMTGDML